MTDNNQDLLSLAAHIAAGGDWPEDMLVEHTSFSDEEWIRVCEHAVKTGDASNFKYMLDEERGYDRGQRARYRRDCVGRGKRAPSWGIEGLI